jgi:hypothetical protein
MLSIAQHRCIGGGAIRLEKARVSSELGDWMLEEAKTCPKVKKLVSAIPVGLKCETRNSC